MTDNRWFVRSILTIGLVLIGLVPAVANAQQATTVSGQVKTSVGGAPLAGVLVSRYGERTLLVGGLLLQAVAMAWIGLIARPDMAYVDLVAPLIIAGFGAAAIPAGQNAVVSAVAPSEIGKASGVFNMLRQLGATFGVAILAAVFASVGGFGSAQAFSDGFAPAMGVAAALALVGAIAGMGLPSQHKAAVAPAQMRA